MFHKYKLKSLPILLLLMLCSSGAFGRNIGFYSGTFDPLHQGHIKVILASRDLLNLDSVYLFPQYSPSDKPSASSFKNRLDMLKLFCMRSKNIKLLDDEIYDKAATNKSNDYITTLINELKHREGNENRFFQICGTDSFTKMAQKKILPKVGENRIVAVIARKGYKLEETEEVKRLIAAGQIRLYDPGIDEISSTAIRNQIQKGLNPLLSQLPEYLTRYIQREGLYHSLPHAIIPSDDYKNRTVKFSQKFENEFVEVSPYSFISKSDLRKPLTFDFDAYIKGKIPSEILEIILTRKMKVGIIAGLFEDAVEFLGSQGFDHGTVFFPASPEMIELSFIITHKGKESYLFITDVFGTERLRHLTLEVMYLYAMNLRAIDDLQIFKHRDYENLSADLFSKSVQNLTADDNSVVMIGYRGAFNFFMSDVYKLFSLRGKASLEGITLKDLDEIFAAFQPKHLLNKAREGSIYFPYWTYEVPLSKGATYRFIAFRNLYGDQTETAIRDLAKKGFKNFVIFGNGGGFGDVEIGKIYAPVLVSDGNEISTLKNAAIVDYPGKSDICVSSILEENEDWLKNTSFFSLVDVEGFRTAKVAAAYPGISIYSGILVSDKPGVTDITKKNEDSADFIAAKRDFIFKAVTKFLVPKKK